LLTNQAISSLKKTTYTSEASSPSSSFSGNFSRLSYDLENNIDQEKDIFKSKELNTILSQLTKRELKFTQAVGFELKPKNTGFDWHVGLVSFNYIMPEDFACSLWIPLDEIDTNKQHGGMAYVSRKTYSAENYFSLVYQLRKQENLSDLLTPEEFRNSQYASKLECLILEKNKVEDDFQVGDVLLFDEFVWHRSCVFKEGLMSSRMAYVMRFVDSQARYSKTFLEGTARSYQQFNKPMKTFFGYKYSDLQDGEMISNHLEAE